MKKFYIICLLIFNFSFLEAQEVPTTNEQANDPKNSSVEMRSRWDLVWRSALLPGWGLIHAKSYRKGIAVAGITTLLARSEYKGHLEELHEKEKYTDSQTYLQLSYLNQPSINDQNLLLILNSLDAKKDLEKIKENNETKLALLGLKYFIQLGYTYWFGISWEKGKTQSGFQFDIQRDSFAIGQNSNAQKLMISYEINF
ncbi:hypothetical protein [Leptospira brenneri]|uniref:DUF5683 domain-containing protein n=1 Tax=Leptospira brenneri TaxID=2023182 RepID=A0A2M9Y4S1_9LEPT|nr:hypothetical protein [Leptospira brenneri]PJZ46396.1 hypothetical protein CH361_04690 [Leptospira brenneri]TGK96498.1 hypothetical protein EHQ30_07815 [Leptospira brenneri]